MAWLVGPTVGGFVARSSFFALFVIDAVISCVVAVLFYVVMPETKPEPHEAQAHEPLLKTFRNYGVVLRDKAYIAFLLLRARHWQPASRALICVGATWRRMDCP